MAQEVLFNYAGDIIKKLGSQALQEIGLWWGLKDEIEKLKSTMSTIQAVLLDAEHKSAQNNQVKVWLGKLREVVYDADDLLDDFSTEALRQQVMSGNKVKKEVCLFFSSSNPIVYGIKMGHKIKEIRERLDAIAKDRHAFHFVEHIIETPHFSIGRDQTISFVKEEDVIGREDDREKILKILFDSNTNENVLVLPIVGIGGLGKTTLAQYVYNDRTVIDKFKIRMWVCVSDVFDIRQIVDRAIKSITNEDHGNLELEQLQNKLRGEISGKKYLLVLDDIWNDDVQKWDDLMTLLGCGARGSRIIVTTRLEKVAKITGTLEPHYLGELPLRKSWDLFKKIVFKGQEPNNPNVRKIGEEIIKKCVGVPLAVRTIAGCLYFKNPETEWSSFLENDLSKIAQNENSILQTLKLSYDHLSSHLKHCFAYCALFPKDYEIDVTQLIHLWIAQGFIESSNSKQCLEDIGLEYFMDLCWRSFFQEVKRDDLGDVLCCKMHDLMHDLATLVSGTGINVLNSNVKINIDEISCQHFSFVYKSSLSPEIMVSLGKAEKFRTLFQLSKALYISEVKVGEEFNKVVFSKLRCIRVCGLHRLHVKVPSYIKILKHLRYLDVSRNNVIETLPSSICQLQNLEVLRISWCGNLKSLPKDIRKLINLRHLYNVGCYCLTHMPHGIGELTSLQTLSLFVVSKHVGGGGLDELNKLNNLRGSLEIRIVDEYVNLKKNGNKKGCNLREKQHLQSLSLSWYRYRGDNNSEEMLIQNLEPHPSLKELEVGGYRGMRFPNWISSLTNLVNLEISYCSRCKNLPPLHRMSSLKKLLVWGLCDLEYMEMEMEGGGEGTGFFPSLEYLGLSNCPKLMGWRKNDDSEEDDETIISIPFQFPCLSDLVVFDCQKLNWMPLFPSLDESLELVEVSVQLLEQILNANPLSKLKKLEISNIRDLECLCDGWHNLTSLQSLRIIICPRLCYLPHLISLRELSFWSCPKLPERYGNKNAEYWHIVSHISFIEVDGQTIQRDGRYLLDVQTIQSDEGRPRYLPDGESIGDHDTEEGDD